jgi:hypothetical protein
MYCISNLHKNKDIISSFLSGSHKKIYHAWKLPDIKDWTNSLSYMSTNLDLIIRNEVQQRNILLDSQRNSLDSFDLDQEDRNGTDAMLASI